jgi:hypothetical protein
MNGRTDLFSVLPPGQQTVDPETGEPVGTPAVQPPPFNSLPPVTMAGSTPSVLVLGQAPAQGCRAQEGGPGDGTSSAERARC